MELVSAVFYAFWQDRPHSLIWLVLILIFMFAGVSQSQSNSFQAVGVDWKKFCSWLRRF